MTDKLVIKHYLDVDHGWWLYYNGNAIAAFKTYRQAEAKLINSRQNGPYIGDGVYLRRTVERDYPEYSSFLKINL